MFIYAELCVKFLGVQVGFRCIDFIKLWFGFKVKVYCFKGNSMGFVFVFCFVIFGWDWIEVY